jgi:hypothetical protein
MLVVTFFVASADAGAAYLTIGEINSVSIFARVTDGSNRLAAGRHMLRGASVCFSCPCMNGRGGA